MYHFRFGIRSMVFDGFTGILIASAMRAVSKPMFTVVDSPTRSDTLAIKVPLPKTAHIDTIEEAKVHARGSDDLGAVGREPDDSFPVEANCHFT